MTDERLRIEAMRLALSMADPDTAVGLENTLLLAETIFRYIKEGRTNNAVVKLADAS